MDARDKLPLKAGGMQATRPGRGRRLPAWAVWTRGAAALLAGLVAGNVLAAQAVKALSFEKTTLFGAIERAHAEPGADVIFAVKGAEAKSFQVRYSDPRKLVSGISDAYGLEAVYVGRIFVLRDALPAGGNLAQRRDALRDYRNAAVPTLNQGGRISSSFPLSDYMRPRMYDLRGQLGIGTRPFRSLPPEQQQMTLDFMRYQHANLFLGHLDAILR